VVNKCTPEAQAACSSEKKAACAQHIAPAQPSSRALAVIGIDSSSSSIVRASENAEQNWLDDRASFYCADLHSESNLSLSTEGTDDNQLQDCWKRIRHLQSLHPGANIKVVIDPAFDGAINVLKSRLLNDFRVRRVVYVSCSGASLARDALLLCEGHGFKLHSLQMSDMFPHTSHIESIAMFVR
jgi:23S rRNA (uracil1939-C5)-methyltransferase